MTNIKIYIILFICSFFFSCSSTSRPKRTSVFKDRTLDIGTKKESPDFTLPVEEKGEEEEEIATELIQKDILERKELFEDRDYEDFNTAEELFQNSQFTLALVHYKIFLDQFDKNEFTDDALYRIGQIYFYLKNYSSSINFFIKILNNFSDSDLYKESEYFKGLCYFFLKDYKLAIETFEFILPNWFDQQRLSEINYFYGKSFYKEGSFFKGVEKLKKSIQLTDKDIIRKKAYNTIKNIVLKDMSKDDLKKITYNYPGEFPSEYALHRLVYYYTGKKDYDSVEKTLKSLLSDFPEYEFKEKIENWQLGLRTMNYSNEIKIGCILPLSGAASSTGKKILRGIRLAINSLADEIIDYEIRLVVKDSEGRPEIAAAAAKDLTLIENVNVIIGPVFSKSASAVAKIADKLKIPVFTPTASANNIPNLSDYMFRNCMTNKSQGKAIAEYAVNKMGLKRFVLFYPNNTYGQRLKESFASNIEKLGGAIAAEQTYNINANDFSSEIKKLGGMDDDEIKDIIIDAYENGLTEGYNINPLEESLSYPIIDNSINPAINRDYIKPVLKLKYDAIFLPGHFNKVGLIAPELAFFNISGIKLLGTNGWNSQELTKIGGKYINNSMFVDGFFLNSEKPLIKKFVTNYIDAFYEEPGILSAQAYDALNIIGKAIKNGYISREGIREYLSKDIINFHGVSGITTILPSGESEKLLFYLEVDRGRIREIKNVHTSN